MYLANQSAEVDEVFLHDISNSNLILIENHMMKSGTKIGVHFNPDLPSCKGANKRKGCSMHSSSLQPLCKIVDCHRKIEGPAENTKNVGGQNEETGDEFIHVRAKRGQATNSHSIAERVRREKISERMRFLQDLVPGCNKIAGKAMMLDEIINYVQSLQRQIEFLSMKLAAICPEANFDLEQIFSRDMLFPPNYTASCLGLVPSSSNSYSNLYGLTPQAFPTASDMQQPPQTPGLWDFDLHSTIQMGFAQPGMIDNSDSMKMENRVERDHGIN